MCYGVKDQKRTRKQPSRFNLDHSAWRDAPAQKPEDDTIKAPNPRHLYAANDWSNLAMLKHRDNQGNLKSTKKPNMHMYDISQEMPPFLLASSVMGRLQAKEAPRKTGKRCDGFAQRASEDNPLAGARPNTAPEAGGKRRPPKGSKLTTRPIAHNKVTHTNNFGIKNHPYDRHASNRFYNSTGGWGASGASRS